ncbi:HigA family addiction module antitoxin [Spirosoma linguale]|uniref:Plasmid maintenance system antidote protein, XRE family n=1 Tax=Spirosoma linguale (strain ATCC 33905 / DSM 74 / LMG 10896 / Claus 1) TaxID=504472 RepID=D2QVV9_SPILD|nr:plasmid maintenance system antidote protein, XRE family [Spirosoma linguale DSM 74]
MHNPPHPGTTLRVLYLENVGLSVTEAAQRLGISRKTLSQIINGHAGISPQMAILLSQAFPNTTPELWLTMQQRYDLWQASQRITHKVEPFVAVEA